MENINTLLAKLLQESSANAIIVNPNTLSKLQRDGLKLDQPNLITPQEFVNNLFKVKKKLALGALGIIPTIYNLPNPVIELLWKEITECVLFGNNGAAISLCAVLVEYALKEAIIKNKYGNKYNTEEWDKIEKIDFGVAINYATEAGILSDEGTKKKFVDFKNDVRNPYLHYNIKKITKGVGLDKVKKMDINTQKIEEVQLNTENDPILWPHAKKFVDKEKLKKVLDFTCYAVDLLLASNKKIE